MIARSPRIVESHVWEAFTLTGGVTAWINRQGFRGREFSSSAVDGAYRIACLGDSFTFGLPGMANQHELTLLRREVIPYDPGMVILQWFRLDGDPMILEDELRMESDLGIPFTDADGALTPVALPLPTPFDRILCRYSGFFRWISKHYCYL